MRSERPWWQKMACTPALCRVAIALAFAEGVFLIVWGLVIR